VSQPLIEVSFPGGVRVDAAFRGVQFKTDQPVREGGEGSAPAPFDLFLVSLATCAGYYIVAFCAERNIPTEGMSLAMTWEWNKEAHLITKFRIAVTLPVGFPEKYRTAVLRAADQCTVKRHMFHPPEFEIVSI
jgi:putative redox protein